jgi:flagellar M-ring protein FliF
MRLAVMAGVMFALVGFVIFLTSKVNTGDMERLYSDLAAKDSAQIVQELEAQGIPYQLESNGSAILVPQESVQRLRLTFASQGLPAGGTLGYELFDNADSIGSTNFMQNVNLVRAMEGELARTIEGIGIVSAARVHLVLPKRELFSRETREPSASVVLQMGGAKRLSEEQVAAVQHLIATAVPSLKPSRISIVDNRGKLLASGADEAGPLGGMAAKVEERRRSYENKLAQTIEELLINTVGYGKVRAEVSAEMDFDRINTTEETFDPDGQVVRSTTLTEEQASSRDSEGTPAVTVGQNLPDPNLAGGDALSAETNEARTEEVTNFEISKKIVNHVREVGVVKRLSVAVLIDGNRVENEDGDMVYEPRSDEEMELLATLVRGAIGFDAERGDTVEVINMEFHDFVPEEAPLELFFGMDKNDLIRLAEVVVLSIVAILVILLVIRPLISRAFEMAPGMAQAAGDRLLAEGADGGQAALMGPSGVPAPVDGAPEDEEMDELIDIDRVEGRVKASSVKKVGEIVDKHPEESLSIIRAWMYQEG